ncbi:hypothetical protein ACHAXS_008424 [Conticribra weissflogii]
MASSISAFWILEISGISLSPAHLVKSGAKSFMIVPGLLAAAAPQPSGITTPEFPPAHQIMDDTVLF